MPGMMKTRPNPREVAYAECTARGRWNAGPVLPVNPDQETAGRAASPAIVVFQRTDADLASILSPRRSHVRSGWAKPQRLAWLWPKGQSSHRSCAALHRRMGIETKLAGLTSDQLRKCALYIQAVATTAATAEERAAFDPDTLHRRIKA